CTSDSACSASQKCSGNKCVAVSCGTCETVSNHACVKKSGCCTSNSECGSGKECKNNACVTKDPCAGVSCGANSYCSGGSCYCNSGYIKVGGTCKLDCRCKPGYSEISASSCGTGYRYEPGLSCVDGPMCGRCVRSTSSGGGGGGGGGGGRPQHFEMMTDDLMSMR
ncbi:MAG: hypothetical protein ACI4PW_04550, partial [Alphaproteobacteria bacterium]